MVEIRKKKRAPPPPTTKVADAQQNVHAKTASVGSMDSGISGGNKSPPESVKSTKITAKKKRAPLPPPVMAKKLSLTRGAVRLPSAERLPSIDSDDNASGSLKEDDFQPTIDLPTHSQTKSNRWTYSELLTADDDADDLFGRGRNSQVIVESEEDDQIDVATVLEDKEVDDIMVPLDEPINEPINEISDTPEDHYETENLETTFGDSANCSVTNDDSYTSSKSPSSSVNDEPIQDLDSGVILETKDAKIEPTLDNTMLLDNVLLLDKASIQSSSPDLIEEKVNLTTPSIQTVHDPIETIQLQPKVEEKSGNSMNDNASHDNIMAEIAAIKQQIQVMKDKRDIKSPATVPFTIGKAATKFKSNRSPVRINPQLLAAANGPINDRPQISTKPITKPKVERQTTIVKPMIERQTTIDLDDRGNIMNSGSQNDVMEHIPSENIIVNRHGKGPSSVDCSSNVSNLKFDNQGNLIKENEKSMAPAMIENSIVPQFNAPMNNQQIFMSQNAHQHFLNHQGQPQMVQSGYYIMPQNPRANIIQPAGHVIDPIRQSSVTIVENGQMNNYIIPNPDMVLPPVSIPPTQIQHPQWAGSHYMTNSVPTRTHSAPPVNIQPPPIQQPQWTGSQYVTTSVPSQVQAEPPVRVTQPFLKNIHSANKINNTRLTKSMAQGNAMGSPVKSYSVDMSTSSANNTPFGPKLSLKKPKLRERVEVVTDREKLLYEVRSMGGYNPDLDQPPLITRQESAPAVMLKPAANRLIQQSAIVEEVTPYDALMDQIKRAASVSDDFIYDGTNQPSTNAPPPPPPPPSMPKFRQIKQKPVVNDLSPADELFLQIRKSASISNEYVFDGSNTEMNKEQVENNNKVTIPKYENTKPTKAIVEPDSQDILLSQIRNGFQLKALPK